MFDWRKQDVMVLVRTSKNVWKIQTGTLKVNKTDSQKKLVVGKKLWKFGGLEMQIPIGISTNNLIGERVGKYKPLLFMENGVLVEPKENLTEAFSALMRPEDVRDSEERSDLAELYTPKHQKSELIIWIVMSIALGIAVGYIVGNVLPMAHFIASSGTTHIGP